MNIRERNRKVAIARWKNLREKDTLEFLNTSEAKLLKSRICGFLAGDGSVRMRGYGATGHAQLDFYPDDKLMMESYRYAIKKVYNKQPTIKKENNYYSVRLSLRSVVEDVLNQTKFGIYTWEVPKVLLSTKEAKREWLSAFFSAEGYVSKDRIRIQTVNKKSMKEVAELLKEFKIVAKYYEYNPKNEKYSGVGILHIGDKEHRRIFYEKIGFYHSKKTKILKESLGL